MVKKGDYVVLKESVGTSMYITKGKVYEVRDKDGRYVLIMNDMGSLVWALFSRFDRYYEPKEWPYKPGDVVQIKPGHKYITLTEGKPYIVREASKRVISLVNNDGNLLRMRQDKFDSADPENVSEKHTDVYPECREYCGHWKIKMNCSGCNAYENRESGPEWGVDDTKAEPKSALDTQIGGNHYKNMAIQPTEYIEKNKMDWCAGNIVKYASRHQFKNGIEDVKKIKHYAELLASLVYGEEI